MKESLSRQEWLIMETLWTRHPLFLSEVMDAMATKVNWTHTTFLTYLKKLVKEGFVSYRTIRGSRAYSPAISREECMARESRSLMSRMTADSTKLFVTNMIREGSLTEGDRQDLRNLIDELAAQAEEDD